MKKMIIKATVMVLGVLAMPVMAIFPQARLDVSSNMELQPAQKTKGGFILNGWAAPRNTTIISQSGNLKKSEWVDYEMSFVPSADGEVTIQLRGMDYKKNKNDKKRYPVWIYWDDLTLEGAVLVNGDFEKTDTNGIPVGWRMKKENYVQKDGRKYIRTWHDASAEQTVIVHKNQKVSIKAKVKPVDSLRTPAEKTYSLDHKLSIKLRSREDFFINPGETHNLHFVLSGKTLPDVLEYKLLDYSGNMVRKGKIVKEISPSACFFTQVKLPAGFYEIEIPSLKKRFGILSIEPFTGERDPFFGIQSDASRYGKIMYPVVHILSRSGIGRVREYRSWREDEYEPDKWRKRTEEMFTYVLDKKIKIMFYLNSPPLWLTIGGKNSPSYLQKYLADFKIEKTLLKMLNRRSSSMYAIQLLNEPDLAPIPADVPMSDIHAYSYILKKNNWDMPIVSPGFSLHTTASQLEDYCRMALLEDVDVLAFHMYQDPSELEQRVRMYRNVLAKYSRPNMPLWITETGYPWPRGTAEVITWRGGDIGNERAPLQDDMISGHKLVLNAINAKACGIASFFPFRFLFLNELTNNYGMLDHDGTPHRIFAAYAFCIRLLSHKTYAGDLKSLPLGVKAARVFSDAKNNIVVFDTGKLNSVSVNLSSLPLRKIYNIDGTELSPISQGIYNIIGGLAWGIMSDRFSGELVTCDTEAMKLLKLAVNSSVIKGKSLPVVYRFHFWNFKNRTNACYIGIPGEIAVSAFNLSDSPVEITPRLVLPASGKLISRLPDGKKMLLAPLSSTVIKWEIDLSACKNAQLPILVSDTSKNAFPVYLKFLAVDNMPKQSICIERLSHWRKNTSGKMDISYVKTDRAVKFHASFSKNGPRWIYPEYTLDKKENFNKALAVSFDIRSHQDNSAKYLYSKVMLVYENGKYVALSFPPPGEDWKKNMVVIPDNLRKNKITKIRIGLGPSEKEVEYMVRNVKIHIQQ